MDDPLSSSWRASPSCSSWRITSESASSPDTYGHTPWSREPYPLLQVPFPYFHLLNVIMMANCLLVSYALVAVASWPISTFAIAVFTSIVLGMRALAISMSDPFGGDEVRASDESCRLAAAARS